MTNETKFNETIRDMQLIAIAEKIAQDTACAQGECSQRIEAILPYLQKLNAGRQEAFEIAAKMADRHAAACDRGSPVSSMAEDSWGSVAGKAIAAAIRKLK